MNRVPLLAIAMVLSVTATGEHVPKARTVAPMTFESILEDGRPAKVDLRGKAVVLDFWATWCSPCVAAIPKFNALVTQFDDRPVVFVSVTDEPEEVVRKFLEKHPIQGFVAIDADGSVFRQHNVKGRPFTVLIDRTGRIAGFTDTYSINRTAVENLLK